MIDYEVKIIGNTPLAKDFVRKGHYSNTCPSNSSHVFGLLDGEEVIGVCMVGPFSRDQARAKYKGALELTRLYIIDDTPKNTESYFISRCLKWLKRFTKVEAIISYADPSVGHQGVIYQASNFALFGHTKRGYHYFDDKSQKRVHTKGVWERSRVNGLKEKTQASREGLTRIEDQAKIIYIYKLRKHFHLKASEKNTSIFIRNKMRMEFFSTWNRESAWVYGLILGDGCVYNSVNGSRVLFFGNRSTVDSFCRLLDIKHKKKGKGGFDVYFDSKAVVSWFEDRGICGKKVSIPWPDDIPDEYIRDFVRGLIDTDGTVTIYKPKGKGNDKLLMGFSSSIKPFCERVHNELSKRIGLKRKISESIKNWNDKKYKCYSFHMGVKHSIALGDWIYENSDGLRNEERYQIYLEGKRLHKATQGSCRLCEKPIHSRGLCTGHMREETRKPKPPCSICGRPSFSKSLCQAGYSREVNKAKALASGKPYYPRTSICVPNV